MIVNLGLGKYIWFSISYKMYLPSSKSASPAMPTALNKVENTGHFDTANVTVPGGGKSTPPTSWITPLEASWSASLTGLPEAVITCGIEIYLIMRKLAFRVYAIRKHCVTTKNSGKRNTQTTYWNICFIFPRKQIMTLETICMKRKILFSWEK